MSEEIKVEQEPTQEEIKEIEENFDFEYTTRMDYVSCAYYSISAVEGIDLLLLTKDEARKIKKIIKKSIRIIESCINEMHDELFEDEEENQVSCFIGFGFQDLFFRLRGMFLHPFFSYTYIFIYLITIDFIEFQRIEKIILKKLQKYFVL